MGYIVTIDSGTSNTRMYLWEEQGACLHAYRAAVGVRNTAMDGHNRALQDAVREGLSNLLAAGSVPADDVKMIIAGGMITSNVGLYELPHVKAPAGKQDLVDGIRAVVIDTVSAHSIHFIPGVKNAVESVGENNFEAMDIMRGEEVETMAVLEKVRPGIPSLLILPGSHTKFVSVDSSGQITGCLTTLTGELLSCITEYSILADAVKKSYVQPDTYDKDMVIKGYEASGAVGFSRAAFSARILNQFTDKKPAQIANFLLGAILNQDITALKHSSALRLEKDHRIVVCGDSATGKALGDLLERDGSFGPVQRVGGEDIPLSAAGAYALAKEYLKQ